MYNTHKHMLKKPFFSIVIPTFNRADDLRFALYCILDQNFKDFEVIISDNCSTDNTKEIVSLYKDKRIKYFRNKENIGVLPNIQNAIEKAKGKYVFLHSDDDFILYKDSLRDIYIKIIKYQPGYVRISYLARTPDRKRLFHYRGNRPYKNDYRISANISNEKILKFILGTDPGFITGMIFKNNLPKNIAVIDSDPFWAIKILFYATKKFGGYFVVKPQIIASWSTWRVNKNNFNPIYSLIKGKLHSEGYFNFIKEILDEKLYQELLRDQLKAIYVVRFPAIKYYTGNYNMLKLSMRLRQLNEDYNRSTLFWIYLVVALILPRFMLGYVKDVVFYKYSRLSQTKDAEEASRDLRKLEEELLHDKINK